MKTFFTTIMMVIILSFTLFAASLFAEETAREPFSGWRKKPNVQLQKIQLISLDEISLGMKFESFEPK